MDPQRVRLHLDRILASPAFVDAERAQAFLRFVVERSLAGLRDEIKETVIAVEVMGRRTSFDPRTDPIVRVEAGRLRSRLLAYYHSQGQEDEIVIDLPKGGYVPLFTERPVQMDSIAWWTRLRSPLAAIFAVLFLFGLWWLDSSFFHLSQGSERAVRLSVLAPTNSELRDSAISPDARYLAFSATSGNVTRIWIRPLDSPDAKALPGTEGAAHPFWSPDSKTIAFFSPKLRKINLAGGPAQVLCDTQASFGGSWSNRGVIIFGQRPSGTLFQVSAEGGTPTPVTKVNRAHGEIAHLYPFFLPDGRHFLYSVISREPAEASLRLGALDSGESRFLLNADPGAVYAPGAGYRSGSIVFGYQGTLMSQPFDDRAQALSGDATEMAPRVRHVQMHSDISVSAGGVIAYQAKNEKELQLTWLDRTGKKLSEIGEQNDYHSISLSPDESHLAIEAPDGPSGRVEIWTMDMSNGTLSRTGSDTEEGLSPIWSPDGREIVFSAATNSVMTLARQTFHGLKIGILQGPRGVVVASDWSRNGNLIAYTKFQVDQGIWIRRVSGSGNDLGRFYSPQSSKDGFNECCAVFSPQSTSKGPRWIAYSSFEQGRLEVDVKAFPSGDRKWQVSTNGGWAPRWSSNGREIFYLDLDGKLMAVSVAAGTDFQAGPPNVLFDTKIPPYNYPTIPGQFYAVAHDGKRFLLNYAAAKTQEPSITILFPPR